MLKEDLRKEFNEARKNGDNITKSAIEGVLAAILLKEKSGSGEVGDSDVISCIEKEIKVQSEIAEIYSADKTKAGDAIKKTEVLKKFMPKALSESEVMEMIKKLDVYNDPSPKTKGMIIKSLMPEISGRFDKSKVNPLVEQYLKDKFS